MKQVLILYPLFAAFVFVNFAVEAQSIRGLKRTLLESKATKEPKGAKQSKASKTKAPKTTKAAKGSKNGKTAVPSSSPTVTQTMAPTGTVSPSASPTVSPTDQPSPSPSASPSGQPSPSPSDVPTFYPTSSPTDQPSLSPSAGPTPVPTPSPSEQPSHSPNASPSTSPTVTNAPTTITASPTPAPVASAPSVCEYDTSAQFAPIATDGGKAIVNFHYYKEGQTSNDDYGYTDGYDDDDDYYYDQIPDFPDENLQVGENGYITFPYPFGCKATDTCLTNEPATLYLFNVTLETNPLKGKDKVYVKEMGDDVIVSWEHVAGKDDSGDVNIQATLRTDGSLTVCTACGSLPTDLDLDILMDRSGSQYDAGTAFRINPAPTSAWPTNMCYDWSPPEADPPTASPTPPPHVCPAGTGFNPISSDSDAGPVGFYYNPSDDDYGYTDIDDTNGGQIPGFSDSEIYVMENGRVDILGTTKWGCNEAGCNGTQVLLFFEDGPASNPLRANGNVYIKDTTVGSDESFLISWEDAGFKTGTGTVNFQAEIFDTGAVKVCFGAGTLAINAELDVEVHTWLKTASMENPTTTKADLADLGVSGWPEEGSCYCAGPSKNYFQVVE